MISCLLAIIVSFTFGNIQFIPHDLYIGDKGILSLHSSDINGDGNIDILYSSIENNSITWLENKGHGNFISHIVSAQIRGSISIFPIDLNSDGNLDCRRCQSSRAGHYR